MSVDVMSSILSCIKAGVFDDLNQDFFQSPKRQYRMRNIIFLGLFLALAFAKDTRYINIKEFEEKYHEEFANPEDEERAAEELAKNEAGADLQNTMYDEGVGHFREGVYGTALLSIFRSLWHIQNTTYSDTFELERTVKWYF